MCRLSVKVGSSHEDESAQTLRLQRTSSNLYGSTASFFDLGSVRLQTRRRARWRRLRSFDDMKCSALAVPSAHKV